jgi:hypothetical protein
MKTGKKHCCHIYCVNDVSEKFHFADSFVPFLSFSFICAMFHSYRTRRIPTKQHFQITVTRHERSDSIVPSIKRVPISNQTKNCYRSVMHRHTCNCERKVFSKRNTKYFNIHASHDFILEYSADIRSLFISMVDLHRRIDYFIWCLVHHVDSGRWLLHGYPHLIESILIQWKFHQALEPVNWLGNWMKTGTQATRMSFTSKFCWKIELDWTG